ncbi:hypothetical protein T261_8284 [Streptomyces lydicus]|nr:hypothetical protein T261_8284 [Streptomyces lydicus]
MLQENGGSILLRDFPWARALGIFDEPPVEARRATHEFNPPGVLTPHAGERPPPQPRRLRLRIWSTGAGIVHLIPRLRR